MFDLLQEQRRRIAVRLPACLLQAAAPSDIALESLGRLLSALVQWCPRAACKKLRTHGAEFFQGLIDQLPAGVPIMEEKALYTIEECAALVSKKNKDAFAAACCSQVTQLEALGISVGPDISWHMGVCTRCKKPVFKRVNTNWGQKSRGKEYVRNQCGACCAL